MIYLLLISIVILLCFAYLVNKSDIMSPSVILCAVYFISTLCAIYNIETWNINLHLNTYFLIMTGLLVFVLTELFVNSSSRKYISKIDNNSTTTADNPICINVENGKTLLVILFDILVIYLFFKEVHRISLLGGNTGGIATMMSYYRNIHSYSTSLLPGEDMSTMVTQLAKVVCVLGYVYLFIFIHNIVYVKDKIARNLKYLLPVLLYSVQSLLNAARIDLIDVMAATLILSYVMFQRKTEWRVNISFKYIKFALIGMGTVFVAFFFLRGFVGRSSEASFIDYITNYIGGSIQLLDIYLQNQPISDGHFGSETIIGLQKLFYKLGLSNYQRIVHLEFRTSGSLSGNTYTALRRYYQDFGLLGIIVCQMILAFLYGNLYSKIKRQKVYNSSFNYWLIVYLMIIPGILMHSVTDTFYAEMLSAGWVIQLVLLRFVYWLIINVEFKFGRSIPNVKWKNQISLVYGKKNNFPLKADK